MQLIFNFKVRLAYNLPIIITQRQTSDEETVKECSDHFTNNANIVRSLLLAT